MGALIVSDGVDVDDGGDHDEGNDAEEELQAFFESATEDEGIETALLETGGGVFMMMVVMMMIGHNVVTSKWCRGGWRGR